MRMLYRDSLECMQRQFSKLAAQPHASKFAKQFPISLGGVVLAANHQSIPCKQAARSFVDNAAIPPLQGGC